MQIQQLFLKPVDRPIDGVIKADDARNLQMELEEYVFTGDVVSKLGTFTDRYLNELTANGVWISGFFGSGKSHLLKMLSLLLEGSPLPSGARPADILLPKIEDEIVRADLAKCAGVPSESILFNIDQKFDGIGGDHSAPILEVFVKVLNERRGYFGKQGYIARFEHDLDVRGEFAPFKQTYLRVNGSEWEKDREALATARKSAFARAYAEHFGVSESEALGVMRQVREDYRVSIEDFARMAREYIDRQPPGFRLNFFVDEVGQFIGQNSKLMLNLQTVVETLATVCNGRAWVFVTSQAALDEVLGTFRGTDAQDLTKIMGRFKTPLTLTSADVRYVIQKRLLAKHEAEPEILTTIFDRERENLQTLFRFGDGSIQLGGWRGSDAFCAFYPFHPYQVRSLPEGNHSALETQCVHRQVYGRGRALDAGGVPGSHQGVARRTGRQARDIRSPVRRHRRLHPRRYADHHQDGRASARERADPADPQGALPPEVGARVQGDAAQRGHPADRPAGDRYPRAREGGGRGAGAAGEPVVPAAQRGGLRVPDGHREGHRGRDQVHRDR
ncbi:MAG: BREX system P-loop protein BrxC [Gemmatimonadetes bacterium]|nr:BREX system P-loop protein BrxC [Gemmatimonadota bacterium]